MSPVMIKDETHIEMVGPKLLSTHAVENVPLYDSCWITPHRFVAVGGGDEMPSGIRNQVFLFEVKDKEITLLNSYDCGTVSPRCVSVGRLRDPIVVVATLSAVFFLRVRDGKFIPYLCQTPIPDCGDEGKTRSMAIRTASGLIAEKDVVLGLRNGQVVRLTAQERRIQIEKTGAPVNAIAILGAYVYSSTGPSVDISHFHSPSSVTSIPIGQFFKCEEKDQVRRLAVAEPYVYALIVGSRSTIVRLHRTFVEGETTLKSTASVTFDGKCTGLAVVGQCVVALTGAGGIVQYHSDQHGFHLLGRQRDTGVISTSVSISPDAQFAIVTRLDGSVALSRLSPPPSYVLDKVKTGAVKSWKFVKKNYSTIGAGLMVILIVIVGTFISIHRGVQSQQAQIQAHRQNEAANLTAASNSSSTMESAVLEDTAEVLTPNAMNITGSEAD